MKYVISGELRSGKEGDEINTPKQAGLGMGRGRRVWGDLGGIGMCMGMAPCRTKTAVCGGKMGGLALIGEKFSNLFLCLFPHF